MAYQNDNERRQFFEDRNIADDREQQEILKGLQPKNQFAFKLFKIFRMLGIVFIGIALLLFGISFVPTFKLLFSDKIVKSGLIILLGISLGFFLLMILVKLIFLRKCPFDDWVFEVAQRDLGTKVIFYTSKCLYIDYDISSAKEVDKRDFVTKMSDLSQNFSYFFVKTFVDQQVIQVECTRRQPIPDRASFSPDDDLFWNIIPLGLTINNTTQMVSPIGWYLNDQQKNEQLVTTVPSTSILICGGTGCFGENEEILMADGSIKKIQDIKQGDLVMGPDNSPRKVINLHTGEDDMFEIETEEGIKHIVNGDHTLVLINKNNNKKINISVKGFINSDDEFKNTYKLIKVLN